MNKKEVFWANLYLTYSLTATNMKSRYRKTIAGFIWVVLNPLMLYAVQSFIFRYVFKIQVRDYSLFLLTGLLPWTFIVRSLEMGIPSLDNAREMLKSLKISPIVLTSSTVLDNFFNFIFAFTIILIPLIVFNSDPGPYVYLVPLPLIFIVVSMICSTFILSVYDIYLRDVRYVVSFINNIMFFLTPVFYPKEILPAKYQFIFEINPYYLLISPFQLVFTELEGGGFKIIMALLKAFILTITILAISFLAWKQNRKKFYSKI